MNQSTELELAKAMPVAPVREQPSVGQMLATIIEKGVNSESVAAVEQLVKLYERMEDRSAEKLFANAFVALQSEVPKVQATKAVPNNDGTVRYKFAPFEDLMEQIGPMLQRHGFTVSFSSRVDGDRLTSACTLQHIGGHKRQNEFTVRIGAGPPKATVSQADGAAATYAKRFALTEALNIVVAHMDNDARLEGAPITPEQAKSLRERVRATASNEEFFLRFAGAKTFEEIAETKYAILDQNLRKKEKTT